MSPDGITLYLIVQELQQLLPAGRVNRVHQPEKQEIVITIRRAGSNYRLLLSSHAENARLHLTGEENPNPPRPPLFCQVLRKYLEGSRLLRIEQSGLDRVVSFTFSRLGESGGFQEVALVCEIMGKHSNLILYDRESGLIIDGIKRYSHAVSRYREVLPGCPYLSPPPQKKVDPRQLDEESFTSLLMANPIDLPVSDLFFHNLAGFGPDLAREVIYQANLDPGLTLEYCGLYEMQRLWIAVREVVIPLFNGKCEPTLVFDDRKPVSCAPLPLTQYQGMRLEHCDTVNELQDRYYHARSELTGFQQLQHRLQTITKHEVDRCTKKLTLQKKSEGDVEHAQQYRLQGEMIYAHLHQIRSGEKEVVLPNLYELEAPPIKVNLDPDLSPVQNAQRLLRKYDKARDSQKMVQKQKNLTIEEINYLASVNRAINQAETLPDLEEVRVELQETGYLKEKVREQKKNKVQKQGKKLPPSLLRIAVADGCEILIGKNNKQNDYLTMRVANDDDLWLHVKDNAGAHVIIRPQPGQEISPTTLEQAASYAAYFSGARQSSKVAVDYTRRKHVSKPPKSRPGYVIYKDYQTAYVQPQEPLTS